MNGHSNSTVGFDVSGLVPAPVTPFTEDGKVDYEAIQRLGSWLGSIDGVKGLVVLGHAGEGTFLTQDEQVALISNLVEQVSVPIIAGITGEGTKVAVEEAQRAVNAGAKAGLEGKAVVVTEVDQAIEHEGKSRTRLINVDGVFD